jgi:hypothetical protein
VQQHSSDGFIASPDMASFPFSEQEVAQNKAQRAFGCKSRDGKMFWVYAKAVSGAEKM